MAALPPQGVIDADGHVLEDADLWERYLEAPYRDRPIRIVQDEEGWDLLEVAGKPFPFFNKGQIAMMGTMGEALPIPGPDRRYADARPFGSADPGERVERLDREGLDAALLYPTIGLQWECAVPEPELDISEMTKKNAKFYYLPYYEYPCKNGKTFDITSTTLIIVGDVYIEEAIYF